MCVVLILILLVIKKPKLILSHIFGKNTNTDIQDHFIVITKTIPITKIIQYTISCHLL